MSWQHIHSAGGDKEVLPGARGREEIGGRKRRERERANETDREPTEDGEVGRGKKGEGKKQMWYRGSD